MNKSVVKATWTSDKGEKPKPSWVATDEEVIISGRENRSAKPAVVYYQATPEGYNITSGTPVSGLSTQPLTKLTTPQIVLYPPGETKLPSAPTVAEFEGPTHPRLIPDRSPAQLGPLVLNLDTGADEDEHTENEQVDADADTNANSENNGLTDSDSDTEMERSIAPSQFCGTSTEDADSWSREFHNYCQYKAYDNAKVLALFKVLLKGNAALWLESQAPETVNDWAALKTAFDDRYKTPEVMRYRSAKEIFSRKQQSDECADDFVANMQKLARTIGADDQMTRYAILNGLRPALQSYVTQREPKTMHELLQAARMAELTAPSASETNSPLANQLANVEEQLKQMSLKWDKLLASPITNERERSVPETRTPSPKRVTFADERQTQGHRFDSSFRSSSRPPITSPNLNRGGMNARASSRGRAVPAQFQQSMNSRCQRCGRRPHSNINYCPAVNQCCYRCAQRGHYAAVCRTALTAESQQPPRQY